MRRRHSDSGSATGNLDSLLDTMTNVVGILIIVIIVSQINVADAVKRIRDGLDPVSAEQMAALESERDQVAQQIETVKSPTNETVELSDLDALRAESDVLKEQVRDATALKVKVDGLVDLFAKKEQQLEKLVELVKTEKEGIVGMEQEISQMQLEKVPPKKVRMPNPRDPYEDANEVLFFCAGDRVILIDYPGLLKQTVESLGGKDALVAELKSNVPYYDQELAKKHLKVKKIQREGVTISINTFKDKPWGQLVLTPNFETGGQTIAEGIKHNSKLRKQINRVKSDRNYIRFFVHPDAFETYLLARRIAEEIYIPVGWDPTSAKEIKRSLPGIRFAHEPPPPDTTPKKPAPKKPTPKKPKVLD